MDGGADGWRTSRDEKCDEMKQVRYVTSNCKERSDINSLLYIALKWILKWLPMPCSLSIRARAVLGQIFCWRVSFLAIQLARNREFSPNEEWNMFELPLNNGSFYEVYLLYPGSRIRHKRNLLNRYLRMPGSKTLVCNIRNSIKTRLYQESVFVIASSTRLGCSIGVRNIREFVYLESLQAT